MIKLTRNHVWPLVSVLSLVIGWVGLMEMFPDQTENTASGLFSTFFGVMLGVFVTRIEQRSQEARSRRESARRLMDAIRDEIAKNREALDAMTRATYDFAIDRKVLVNDDVWAALRDAVIRDQVESAAVKEIGAITDYYEAVLATRYALDSFRAAEAAGRDVLMPLDRMTKMAAETLRLTEKAIRATGVTSSM